MPKKSADATGARDPDRESVPIVQETARVLKHKALTEGVRVATVVRDVETVVEETLAAEDVDIERVPLDLWVDAAVPLRQDGETTIITLVEEVIVVEKRLRAVAEVRITRRRSTRRFVDTVTLRREEAVVERVPAAGESDGAAD